MKGLLLLVSVALWVNGPWATPTNETEEKVEMASTDDVNVLMYGVLQFSEVLHSTYYNTDSKLTRIADTLQRQQGALEQLKEVAEGAAHTEEQLKHALAMLQTQTAGLQLRATELGGTVSKVEQEEVELRNQVTTLESALKNSAPGKISTLKELTVQNAGVLKALVKWIQDHRKSLEDQNQQLTSLQRMMHEPGTPPLTLIS
nr:uncharacterized protein LOC111849149 [Paramormyrops kingsleyae]